MFHSTLLDHAGSGAPLPSVRLVRVPRPVPESPWKRRLDVVAAASLLVGLLPLLAALALAVELSSRGRAFYRQRRVGRGGVPFDIIKFRTMVPEAERDTGPVWSGAGDARVTRLGRLLRASHLDELPQLWNVLRGDMSLVGPRPERPEFVTQLARAVPGYTARLRVRPGITGLAQVRRGADRTVLDVRRKVAWDRLYVRRRGLVLDLRILLSTLPRFWGG